MTFYTASAAATADLPSDAIVTLVMHPGYGETAVRTERFTVAEVTELNTATGVDVVELGYVPSTRTTSTTDATTGVVTTQTYRHMADATDQLVA